MDIGKIFRAFDRWQQKHPFISFPAAVIKKYGDDNGGYQAALLTYYGFLSLFPLLLILLTMLQLGFQNDHEFRREVTESVGHFFPLVGERLEENIHGMRRAGIGLIIGLLFTLYGARGAADAFRFTVDNMWQIPRSKRVGFPRSILNSLAILGAALAGFAATVAVSIFTADLGHSLWVKIFVNLAGFGILTLVLGYTYRIATSGRIRYRYMFLGAAIAALLIQLLLTFGGILLSHELKNFTSFYGTFAVVLGLLFWIYLMSQIVLLAAEIDTVRHFNLWPRSLTGQVPTKADEYSQALFSQEDKYVEQKDLILKLKQELAEAKRRN